MRKSNILLEEWLNEENVSELSITWHQGSMEKVSSAGLKDTLRALDKFKDKIQKELDHRKATGDHW